MDVLTNRKKYFRRTHNTYLIRRFPVPGLHWRTETTCETTVLSAIRWLAEVCGFSYRSIHYDCYVVLRSCVAS